jgi:hypothetical protein
MGVIGMLEMKTVFAEPEGWAVISGEKTANTDLSLLPSLQFANKASSQMSTTQSRLRKQVTPSGS